MSEETDHAAICRIYADELLGEPAVSRCLRAGADEIERLTADVERLRQDLFRSQLTPKERKAVAFAEQHFVYFKNQARTLRGLLKRLGSVE